jgi:hypothetical protein
LTLTLTTSSTHAPFPSSIYSCLGLSSIVLINLIEAAADAPRPGRCPVTEIPHLPKIPIKHVGCLMIDA